MKIAHSILFFSFAALGVIAVSCGGISDPSDIVFPADSVSYAKQVEPFMALACESTGCHNQTDNAGGVTLQTWTDIMNSNIVVQKDTTTSILYQVMIGKEVHNAPLNANANQRQGIGTWIMEGAPQN